MNDYRSDGIFDLTASGGFATLRAMKLAMIAAEQRRWMRP